MMQRGSGVKKAYATPGIVSQKSFETDALGCAKTVDPSAGSYHFYSA